MIPFQQLANYMPLPCKKGLKLWLNSALHLFQVPLLWPLTAAAGICILPLPFIGLIN